MKLKFAGIMCLLLAAGVYAQSKMPTGVKEGKASSGTTVLMDSNGMTLYTFGRDATPGKSMCNDRCAMAWPPLAAETDAKDMGDWTVVTRDDGSKMWAYNGKPLYTYAMDKPGDTSGDGKGNGAWKVATP